MYAYEIIPEKELIIMVFSDTVDFQEIMKANAVLTKDPSFNKNFNGVVDHRKSKFQLTLEEVNAIAESVSNNDTTVGRWVIMVSNPATTAFSTLYAKNIQQQHPQSICTTIKGAEMYLDIDLTGYLDKSPFD